uniref:Fibronectin type-III domain-containing protein n=2 Tax=Clastoptera arizonana TaxID=38151 RepID=A0A1B6C3U2_9HEMI
MDNLSIKTLSETVETATEYSFKLQDLMKSVIGAQNQVKITAEESNLEIDRAFDELTNCVLDALNSRREALKAKVTKIQEEGATPLNECYKVICETLKNTHTYICEGQDLLHQHDKVDINSYVQYLEQSALLGNLPAVPNLEEVPAITFQLNVPFLCKTLINNITSAGIVFKMGPVQIVHVCEKPGALLVEWEEVETERPLDVQKFCLEVAVGSHPAANHRHTQATYREVYVGPDTCYLVKDLHPKQSYTLRVRCKAEDGEWSAWSLPRVACTNLAPFGWQVGNPHYSVNVGGKIACKTSRAKQVLQSNMTQFGPNHSIEFTILESGDTCSDFDGLGLVDPSCTVVDSLQINGVMYISTSGLIFLDGKEKTTRLPPLIKSSRITFTCEPLKSSRVRVHIDSGDKAVTYDWIVSSTNLRFAMMLTEPKWKVMVE